MTATYGQGAAFSLLRTWCDGLIAHQILEGEERGGLMCPACGFVHGRSADAVYPLLAMFSRTGDEKYRRAAFEVFEWAERHVSQPDGSWLNENYLGAWKGISCFCALALGEALRHYGDELAPQVLARWRERLRRGADFLLNFMSFEVGDINYPISTSAALALAWTLLGEEKYRVRARELAHFGLEHFTANGLLWGEGPRGQKDISPRGFRPIDVGYNVEESLPNLALYGELMGDETVLDAVAASLRAHLPFLLPDGGWDAGWCSRQYKWTYWGSRTSDGCAAGYGALQERDPRFAVAVALNLRLLGACTHGGLLFGGPHLHSRGIPPCIHHTFCHAKGVAAALDAGYRDAVELARGETALAKPVDGVREWSEVGVYQVICGPWRASITANDLPHTTKRGGYPSGGALSLLWHEKVGPLCVASMNDYVLYEGSNMQKAASEAEKFVLTPRLDLHRGDEWFSSLHDQRAQINWHQQGEEIVVTASGVLKNSGGVAIEKGDYQFSYHFAPAAFHLEVECTLPGAHLVFPVISRQEEAVAIESNGFHICKPHATVHVRLEGSCPLNMPAERVFNFVPGFEALPVVAALNSQYCLRLTLEIEGEMNYDP